MFHGQLEMFLEHVYYLDRIDISTLAKGVKNSLHKNILSWENIDANEFVLQAIKNGYVIPFLNNLFFFFMNTFNSLRSNINLFLPELLTETLSGLTTKGRKGISMTQPLLTSTEIASFTKSECTNAELLFLKNIRGGLFKNGITYPFLIA
jgi:hypothetical protein